MVFVLIWTGKKQNSIVCSSFNSSVQSTKAFKKYGSGVLIQSTIFV